MIQKFEKASEIESYDNHNSLSDIIDGQILFPQDRFLNGNQGGIKISLADNITNP